jgi:hypothetical protein
MAAVARPETTSPTRSTEQLSALRRAGAATTSSQAGAGSADGHSADVNQFEFAFSRYGLRQDVRNAFR